jgi:hypothetical protein
MKQLILLMAALVLTTSTVLAATTISGPTFLDPGATGTYATTEAVTVSFPKYLTGSPGTCAFGINTATYRKYDCPAGGTFSVRASLTPGAFAIRASDGAILSVTVGTTPPTPAPTSTPTPLPAGPIITVTPLNTDTFRLDITATGGILVRFDRALTIDEAPGCVTKTVRQPRWAPPHRLGVDCAGSTSLVLTIPPGSWTIYAYNESGGYSSSVVLP